MKQRNVVRVRRTAVLVAGLAIACLLAAVSCWEGKDVAKPGLGRLFDFSLVDVNPNSSTYRQLVSLVTFQGHPVVLYAGNAG